MRAARRKRLNVLSIVLFFALVLGVWISMSFLYQTKTVELSAANGHYDLCGYDFERTVYHAQRDWESWPGALYTPEDFAKGKVTGPAQSLSEDAYRHIRYATHRLRLTLPPGQTYGISMLTSEYAMRLYLDGVEIDSVGTPGTTRETTEHRSLERVYYFTTQTGEVELLVQASNFVHAKGGAWPPQLYLGTAENISRHHDASLAFSFMIIGCLVAAFLYHVGLFCLNRSRKAVLLFAVSCLLLALLNKKLILMVWPGYHWQAGIRIEYAIHFLTFAVIVSFLDKLLPKLLHKWVVRGYYALCGLYLLTLLLDSTVFTGLLAYFEAVSLLLILYILIAMALRLRHGHRKEFLSFAGVLVLGLLGANDILYYRGIVLIAPVAGQFFMAPIGMVFFVFCYAMVLSVEHAQTERAMLDGGKGKRPCGTERVPGPHESPENRADGNHIPRGAHAPCGIGQLLRLGRHGAAQQGRGRTGRRRP